MNQILVLYPELFKCYPKFARKVCRIISRMDEVVLVVKADPNGFVQRLAKEVPQIADVRTTEDWEHAGITHAIVFDDGEEFPEEATELAARKIPFRQVQIRITRVVNIKVEKQYEHLKSTPEYEYIGRGSYWGNPYSMFEEGEDREEVIRKYKYDFDYDKFPRKEKSEVFKLAGKRLGCFCKPQACHGDVLADFLNAWDDGK